MSSTSSETDPCEEKIEGIISSCYIVTVGIRKVRRARVFRHSKMQIMKTLINYG